MTEGNGKPISKISLLQGTHSEGKILLPSVSAVSLIATILDFTQGIDKYIPLYAGWVHRLRPDLRIHVNEEVETGIRNRVEARMKAGTHLLDDAAAVRFLVHTNAIAVEDTLSGELQYQGTMDETGTLIQVAEAMVERDINYLRRGRPGRNSMPRQKFCEYVLGVGEEGKRKITNIEELNLLFADISSYFWGLTRKQLISDSKAKLDREQTAAEALLSNIERDIRAYNEDLGHKEKVTWNIQE